jgi:hypothetical protein
MQQITVGTPVRVTVPDTHMGGVFVGVVTSLDQIAEHTLVWLSTPFGQKFAMADWCQPRVMIGGINPPRTRNIRAFYARRPWFRASAALSRSYGRADRALFALAQRRQRYVKRQTDADAYRAGQRHLDMMEMAACRRVPGGF